MRRISFKHQVEFDPEGSCIYETDPTSQSLQPHFRGFFQPTSFIEKRKGSKGESGLPKGIDPVTLDKILDEMNRKGGVFTSEEMAERVGASRTTARRYLEYLVSQGSLEVDVSYGGVGRPERNYDIN